VCARARARVCVYIYNISSVTQQLSAYIAKGSTVTLKLRIFY